MKPEKFNDTIDSDAVDGDGDGDGDGTESQLRLPQTHEI